MTETHWIDHFGVVRPVPVTRFDFQFGRSAGHRALRAFVFQRDRFTCQACGLCPSAIPENYDGTHSLSVWFDRKGKRGCHAYLVMDHVHPRKLGGGNHPSNLQVLCSGCNSAKSNRVNFLWERKKNGIGWKQTGQSADEWVKAVKRPNGLPILS